MKDVNRISVIDTKSIFYGIDLCPYKSLLKRPGDSCTVSWREVPGTRNNWLVGNNLGIAVS
jgi:hypothetical protein